MQIVSASRRTDIPAFYGRWLVNRLNEERALSVNPFTGMPVEVSLVPSEVYALVLWSKNFKPFLKFLDSIDSKGYNLYFQYTITGIRGALEPGVPEFEEMIETFCRLAERYSAEQVQWRFDPILLTSDLDKDTYIERFRYIAERLHGSTRRCYVSFAYPYRKALKRIENHYGQSDAWNTVCLETKMELGRRLLETASAHGIELLSCCDPELEAAGLERGSCIDYDHMKGIFGDNIPGLKRAPTRKSCRCFKSVDIGIYNTCLHGCLYCYANASRKASLENHSLHSERYSALIKKRISKSRVNR